MWCLILNRLQDLRVALCYPGVTRMAHDVRTKNLPYSLADFREMTANCRECLKIKSQIVHSDSAHLIRNIYKTIRPGLLAEF